MYIDNLHVYLRCIHKCNRIDHLKNANMKCMLLWRGASIAMLISVTPHTANTDAQPWKTKRGGVHVRVAHKLSSVIEDQGVAGWELFADTVTYLTPPKAERDE